MPDSPARLRIAARAFATAAVLSGAIAAAGVAPAARAEERGSGGVDRPCALIPAGSVVFGRDFGPFKRGTEYKVVGEIQNYRADAQGRLEATFNDRMMVLDRAGRPHPVPLSGQVVPFRRKGNENCGQNPDLSKIAWKEQAAQINQAFDEVQRALNRANVQRGLGLQPGSAAPQGDGRYPAASETRAPAAAGAGAGDGFDDATSQAIRALADRIEEAGAVGRSGRVAR